MKARFLMTVGSLFIMCTALHAQNRFEGKWATDPAPDGRGGAGAPAFSSAPVFTSAPVYTNPPAASGADGIPGLVPGGAPIDSPFNGLPAGPAPGALFGGPRGGATGTLGGPSTNLPTAARGGGAPGGATNGARGGGRATEIRLDLKVEGSRLTGTIFAYGTERVVTDGVVNGKQARFKTAGANNGTGNNSPLLTSDANWTADMRDENTLVLRHEFTNVGPRAGGGRSGGPGGSTVPNGAGPGNGGPPAPVTLHRVRQ